MGKLVTPFGEISILIDGREVPYTALKGKGIEDLCPDVLGRFQIEVEFVPDGKAHTIACVFAPTCSYERGHESGEHLECQGFYNDNRFKMSIGTTDGFPYAFAAYAFSGIDISTDDYDTDYLENGMAYLILPDTKIREYTFGISWIDDVGWNDPFGYRNEREVQTWYGADPNLSL